MFSWNALRDVLQASTYLEPTDDLTTQRGLVATAQAIVERMAYDVKVPWVPQRVIEARAKKVAYVEPTWRPSDLQGGAKVALVVTPRTPRPGGAAVRIADTVGF